MSSKERVDTSHNHRGFFWLIPPSSLAWERPRKQREVRTTELTASTNWFSPVSGFHCREHAWKIGQHFSLTILDDSSIDCPFSFCSPFQQKKSPITGKLTKPMTKHAVNTCILLYENENRIDGKKEREVSCFLNSFFLFLFWACRESNLSL